MLRIIRLPTIAGIIRLINQMPAVVKIIPALLALNSPVKIRLTFPLNPNSAMAKVGITAITTNETLTVQKACHQETSTSKKRNNR